MGFFSDLLNRIFPNRQVKLLESATNKEIEEFEQKLSELQRLRDKDFTIKGIQLIDELATKVKTNSIDIGGTPEQRSQDPYALMQEYFRSKPEGETIRKLILSKECQQYAAELKKWAEPNTERTIIERWDDFNEIINRYLQKHPIKDRVLSIKPLTDHEKLKIALNIVSNASLTDTFEDTTDAFKLDQNLKYSYKFYLYITIKNCKSTEEQIALYKNYVKEFLGGAENPEDELIRMLNDSDFAKKLKNLRLNEQYHIPFRGKPLTIYETEGRDYTLGVEENEVRAEENVRQGKVDLSGLALVRTTNVIPRFGVLETYGKHLAYEKYNSYFQPELRKLGQGENPRFNRIGFMNRRTIHFSLNGLVGDHAKGTFSGRDFIIIEPLEEQINNPNLLNINEADTYFLGDVKLSKKATILMQLEKYLERIKDPAIKKQLDQFDVRLFIGDEKKAVEMCLVDRGFTFGKINEWGFNSVGNSSEKKNEDLLEQAQKTIAEQLKKEGRDVTYGEVHSHSESRKIDVEELRKIDVEEIGLFVDILASKTEEPFSKCYLKNYLLFRRDNYVVGENDLWRIEGYEESYDVTPDYDKPILTPDQLIKKIGVERLALVTAEYNRQMEAIHIEARKAKDQELVKSGLITQEQLEGENDLSTENK